MKTHIGYVKNYARPEACTAEGYLAGECISFCLDFLKNHTPVEEAVKRNEDVESDDVLLEGRPLHKAYEWSSHAKVKSLGYRANLGFRL